MADAEQHIVRWFDEIYNRRNLAAIDELMLPGATLYDAGPNVEMVTGPAEFRAIVEELLQAFPDLHIEVDDVIGAGNRAAVRLSVTGTHLGAWRGLAPTEQRIAIRGMAFGEWEDDRLLRGWNSFDILGLLTQLGVVPGRAS